MENSRTSQAALGKVPCVCLRRDQFQQVLVTLIRNAQQAGGEQDEVHISTSAGDRKVTVLVQDAGSGISPERPRSIFQPFQTSKEEGPGIGPCQYKKFVEAHGGTIRVDSQVNFGTTMQIELPAAGSGQTVLSPETRHCSA
jgi:signal transduction histidine kinase